MEMLFYAVIILEVVLVPFVARSMSDLADERIGRRMKMSEARAIASAEGARRSA